MYHAIKLNDLRKIEALISSGTDINAPTAIGHGYTPLGVSIAYDVWDCFELLLSKKADVNAASGRFSPIELATVRSIKDKDTKYFDRLYARSDLKIIPGLEAACSSRNCFDIGIFEKLLNHPSQPSSWTSGLSYLMRNLATIGKPEFFDLLFTRKIPLD